MIKSTDPKTYTQRGGYTTAIKQRRQSLKSYYSDPKFCIHCGKKIFVRGRKVSDVRKCKFCNQSCAAKHNNSKKTKKINSCDECGKSIRSNGRLCKSCYNETVKFNPKDPRWNRTKRDLIDSHAHWSSYRSTVSSHARKVAEYHGLDKKCKVCGYSFRVDLAHIKAVSEFDDSSLLSEINNISNLVYLCKNHHTEYDEDVLDLSAPNCK